MQTVSKKQVVDHAQANFEDYERFTCGRPASDIQRLYDNRNSDTERLSLIYHVMVEGGREIGSLGYSITSSVKRQMPDFFTWCSEQPKLKVSAAS